VDANETPHEEEHPTDELLDKYFDTFKHLTTLNLAAAVLAIAVLRDDAGRVANGVGAPVVFFMFSLIAALNGMHIVLRYLRRITPITQIHLSISFGGSVALFLLGLALVGAFILY
jgi:hypothetical protein